MVWSGIFTTASIFLLAMEIFCPPMELATLAALISTNDFRLGSMKVIDREPLVAMM